MKNCGIKKSFIQTLTDHKRSDSVFFVRKSNQYRWRKNVALCKLLKVEPTIDNMLRLGYKLPENVIKLRR